MDEEYEEYERLMQEKLEKQEVDEEYVKQIYFCNQYEAELIFRDRDIDLIIKLKEEQQKNKKRGK